MKKMIKKTSALAISAFVLAQYVPFTAVATDADKSKLTIVPYTVSDSVKNGLNATDNGPTGTSADGAANSTKIPSGATASNVKFNVTRVNTDGTTFTGTGAYSGTNNTVFDNLPDGYYLIDPIDDSTDSNFSASDAFIIQLPVATTTGNNRDVYIYPKLTNNNDTDDTNGDDLEDPVANDNHNVTLTKTDSKSASTPVVGATYKVYYKNAAGKWTAAYDTTNEAEMVYTTNSAGKIQITGLPIGTYFFIEQSAPTTPVKYLLDQEPIKFTIDGTGAATVNVTNDSELEVDKEIIEGGGHNYNWKITADVPAKVANLKSYTITDSYNANVKLADTPITSVTCGTADLGSGDYTVNTSTSGKIIIELTAAGIAKLTASTPVEITVASTLADEYNAATLAQVKNEVTSTYQYVYDPDDDPEVDGDNTVPDDPDKKDIVDQTPSPVPDPDPSNPTEPNPYSFPGTGGTIPSDEFIPVDIVISNYEEGDTTKAELPSAKYEVSGCSEYADDDANDKLARVLKVVPGEYTIKQKQVDGDHVLNETVKKILIERDGKIYDYTGDQKGDEITQVVFTNAKKGDFNLPFTGTTATIIFTITGVLLMAGTGFLIFILLKKKDDDEEEQENN